jgi:tyrosine-protein kinase Etk/Wzc
MADASQNGMADDEIDLRELFALFYSRKFTIIGITFLAALIGVAYAFMATPIYQADALIQIEEKSGGGLAMSADLAGMLGGTEPQSVAEIEILRSRMILGDVVDTLNMDWTAEPKRLPLVGNFLKRYDIPNPNWGLISSYAWHDEIITLGWLQVPEEILGEPLVLTHLGNGAFTVDLGFGSPLSGQVGKFLKVDGAGFSLMVNKLEGPEGRQYTIQQDHISDVFEDFRENLSISERGKNSSIIHLALKHDDGAKAVAILDHILRVYLLQNLSRNAAEAESSLSFIEQQLPEAQTQVRAAEDTLNAYKLSQDSIDLTFETLSLLEQSVGIESQLNELALEEQELQKRFTQNHPAYQTLLDSRTQLEGLLNGLRAESESLPETQLEMLRLSLDLEVAQEMYVQLVGRAQELSVVKAGTLANIRVIDTALADPDPIEPKKMIVVLLAAILGGILSIAFVLIRSFITRGIETTEEIEQLGIPVYATVSKVGNGEYNGSKGKGALKVLAEEAPTEMAVEALRSLRTSLHFGMLEAQKSILMVTSTRPGEGKSFLSVNLATVMAQSGQNVCLVDVDIRRGYLRRFFGVDKKAPGLTDVLAGEALIEDVVHQDSGSGLYFIPAGKYPPNPSELLMHANFSKVLDYLDERFDMTVLDTPPLLAVTDPIIIGKYVGMTLLVARHLLTNAAEIKNALKTAETNGIKISGAVLNVYDAKKSKHSHGTNAYQYEYKSRKE